MSSLGCQVHPGHYAVPRQSNRFTVLLIKQSKSQALFLCAKVDLNALSSLGITKYQFHPVCEIWTWKSFPCSSWSPTLYRSQQWCFDKVTPEALAKSHPKLRTVEQGEGQRWGVEVCLHGATHLDPKPTGVSLCEQEIPAEFHTVLQHELYTKRAKESGVLS